MKAKIKQVKFVKPWGEGARQIFYHDVWLEGQGDKPWNIGAKQENPDFLSVGKELEYDVTDESKRKIKRAKQFENSTRRSWGGGGGNYSKPAKPEVDLNSTSFIRALDNIEESNLMFIDIETVRAVKKLEPGTPIHDAWLYKTRYNNELERKSGEPVTPEQYFDEKAALYAPFSKIVAIVVGRIKGDELSTKSYAMSNKTNPKWDEAAPLLEFNNDIKAILEKKPNAVFAGWANKTFDQPFIAKRMYVNRIQPNILLDTAHLKPWEVSGIDLKELWAGTAFYPDSMIAAAVALGLPSPKNKMDGSEVGDYYYAGKIDEIVEYCTGDVLTSASIYRVLKNKPLLTLK